MDNDKEIIKRVMEGRFEYGGVVLYLDKSMPRSDEYAGLCAFPTTDRGHTTVWWQANGPSVIREYDDSGPVVWVKEAASLVKVCETLALVDRERKHARLAPRARARLAQKGIHLEPTPEDHAYIRRCIRACGRRQMRTMPRKRVDVRKLFDELCAGTWTPPVWSGETRACVRAAESLRRRMEQM